jgi:hypothetical protein
MHTNFVVGSCAWLLLSSSALAATALTIDPASVFPTGTFVQGTEYSAIGWEFTPDQDIMATRLGVFDGGPGNVSDGFSTAIYVGIFELLTESLVATATMASGASGTLADGFRYVAITPTLLTAGTTYVIANTSPAIEPFTWAPPMDEVPYGLTDFGVTATAHAMLTLGAAGTARYLGGSSASLQFPGLTVGESVPADTRNLMIGPNFEFHTVPEPSSVLLAAAGLAALVLRKRL